MTTDDQRAELIHPFVRLMRLYCIDYTNSHDQSWYPEIFEDDYVVNINGLRLVRDESYGPATKRLFDEAPGLGLVVHEFVLNGDRLAMRFSEHASMPNGDGSRSLTCWAGIGLYKWNGRRLTENYVEQDFLSRRRQQRSGVSDALEPPHLDPWVDTQPVATDATVEANALSFVRRGDFTDAARVEIDAGDSDTPIVVAPDDVVVNDIFSAGDRVAVHATLTGPYVGGIDRLPASAIGQVASLPVAALLQMQPDGSVGHVRAVTSRELVFTHLRPER